MAVSTPRPCRIVLSAAAARRLDAAAEFLRQLPADQPVTVVAATRGAADDLARRVARERGATFGVSRFSLMQLVARVAAVPLVERGLAPMTTLGAHAVAARVAFESTRAGSLSYFARVVSTPGFHRALAGTVDELRLSGLSAGRLPGAGEGSRDLAGLLGRVERELSAIGAADRARLIEAAIEGLAVQSFLRAPLVMLDVSIESAAEDQFVTALVEVATAVLATVPSHDRRTLEMLQRSGGTPEPDDEPRENDLQNLRAFLFAGGAPDERGLDGSLELFSAPGEARECIEIVRRILVEARRGVAFDEMAVLLRAPRHYHGLLEHAFHRAQVPAWFERGTRRPHPAGRAFLAILACAAEGLSAKRFAEFLSLGQIPWESTASGHQTMDAWVVSSDDVFGPVRGADPDASDDAEPADLEEWNERASIGGTLRTPRQWERMLVDAAVIGGGPARWERRLEGLAAELRTRRDEAHRQDAASPRAAAIERDLTFLDHLRDFALPIVRTMAEWPPAAVWGEWLDRLGELATRVVRVPAYILRVLADLRPMAGVGPVSLDEVRTVLAERLRFVDADPPARRYGRVFVGSPAQARGRAFRIVFVPGLAERLFPQRPAQDPLLPDRVRAKLDPGLTTRADRARHDRLLLHLAVGSATERLYVSYPRIDVAAARARVPSFYALDVLRGATGRIPDHERLAAAAAQAGDRSLAWPAPADPQMAIDDQEHDLAVLRGLLDAANPSAVRGHAQYMLRLNPALRRSVAERWARSERRWTQFDGLIRVVDGTREALDSHRLGARAYSLTALQRFASCPYQFLLGAVYRLEPAEQPEPLRHLDPLTKGSIVHRMQTALFRELEVRSALPVTHESLELARAVLEAVVERVAEEYREALVPAIDRVWREEMAGIARDLREWLQHVAADGPVWLPRFFEFAFGLPSDPSRDPRSVPDPARIDGRFVLRGSVDLIEEHRLSGELRVTDHKTGRNRTKDNLTIGGGTVLQPVLYSMAVELVTGKRVAESRLFFCTSAGGYAVRPVAITPQSRRAGVEALEIIDRAIERGVLAAAPAEGACGWCDFRSVCGPNEERRVARKPREALRDLLELRSRP
jgi:ATP-dependent helicase/nuclease subunit B